MKSLLTALGLLLGLGLPADAATYYADDTGVSGTACTSGTPCSLTNLIAKLVAGDIGVVRQGTYGGTTSISGKNGTSSNRITLRAENFAVNCPDPTGDPDGCVVANTGSRSILNDLVFTNGDFWTIEGLQYRQIRCVSGSANNILRFNHGYIDSGAIGGAGHSIQLNSGCDNWLAEHGYITKTDDEGGDYGFTTFWARDLTVRNYYIAGGNLHHAISMKRGGGGHLVERLVCEGHESQCVFVAQEMDDTAFSSDSSTNCGSVTMDAAPSPASITDQTMQDVTLRNIFGRNANQSGLVGPAGTSKTRSVIMIDNARNVTVENVLAKVGGHPDGPVPIWIRNTGSATNPGGRCGAARGNLTFRGIVVDAVGSTNGCIGISTLGESPATLTIENLVCHNSSSDGIEWASNQLGNAAAWATTSRPATTIRNSVFSDCTSAWNNTTGTVSFTQSHNDFFACGGSKGGTGAQTVNPGFAGGSNPSVPLPTLPTTHFGGKWASGANLWDWEGVYQPIINEFATDPVGDVFLNAGTGTASPCTGAACDIGANEFFVPLAGEEAWASCAFYDNGDMVFEDYAEPWLVGRAGVVVDIDCAAKKIVIGRCTDPLDEATCDTDIYIHKDAQLRKEQANQSVVLNSGVTGAPADTSGACWRTRATYDFSETLEELTGIWVRFEVDPNGATHTCAAPPGEWAFQAHD